MEYKIEKISGIENLIEFEEYYDEILGYSEGFFLARRRYDRKDETSIKDFFNIGDEELQKLYSYDKHYHTPFIELYFFEDPISKKKLGPYRSAETFSCKLASVNYRKEFIDRQGNVVMNTRGINIKGDYSSVEKVYPFKEDIAVAIIFSGNKLNEYNVFLNRNWKFLHNRRYYEEAGNFCEGVSLVYKNFNSYIVDKKGNMRMNPFENTLLGLYEEGFSEGLCAIYNLKTHKYGFIDIDFNLVIPMEYDEVKNFSCGLAAVKKGDKWGYIDKQGNIKIPFIFDEADSFKNGIAVVRRKLKINGKEEIESALIDNEGKTILDYSKNNITIHGEMLVMNNLEYIPIKDMKISYGVIIDKGYEWVDKSFDSLEERNQYFELASKEIENSCYKEENPAIKKQLYRDLDNKLDELENSSLVKKHN